MADEIPVAAVPDVYQALAQFYGRMIQSDGLVNVGERTAAQIDAAVALQEWCAECGASIVEWGTR